MSRGGGGTSVITLGWIILGIGLAVGAVLAPFDDCRGPPACALVGCLLEFVLYSTLATGLGFIVLAGATTDVPLGKRLGVMALIAVAAIAVAGTVFMIGFAYCPPMI